MKLFSKYWLNAGKSVLLIIFFLAHPSLAAQQNVLEIIPLSHRPAEEMAKIIRPILDKNETVIATGFKLIVKVSPARLEEIRGLIGQLDTKVHRLMITVTQGNDFTLEQLNAHSRINVRIGDNESEGNRIQVRGHYYQTESKGDFGSTQRLQTMEGSPAIIRIGEEFPVYYYSTYQYGGEIEFTGGTEYREATTGFEVIPRLTGKQVILEISPWSDRRSTLGNGSIDTQSAHTTIRASLGEWVEIGGQVETKSLGKTGLFSRTQTTGKQRHRIFVKVDDLDQE